MPPFFTVITATYNAAATLPQLLESLAAQSCRDFEWLVQDGGSADTTLELIEAWRDRLPAVSVQSAPDKGIYDAWNKALDRGENTGLGQWVLFLGADDALADADVLLCAAQALRGVSASVRYAVGGVTLFSAKGVYHGEFPANVDNAVARLHQEMIFCHTGVFHRGTVFQHTRFDGGYYSLGDYEFFCRTLTQDAQVMRLDHIITHMALGGVSTRLCSQPRIFCESVRIALKHFGTLTVRHGKVGCIVSVVWMLCRVLGAERAARFVDATRRWRGKPAYWHQPPAGSGPARIVPHPEPTKGTDVPLVSIITVCRNAEATITRTIASVAAQKCARLEYIVIDGASTDGTVDILKNSPAVTQWISEPDHGIVDAFNKGLAMARGQWIGIINADDWYEDDAVVLALEHASGADVVHGSVRYWEADTAREVYHPAHEKLHLEMTINHPSMFVRRSVYEELGGFDPAYKYAMDYELALRLMLGEARFQAIPQVMANMRYGGTSDTYWWRAAGECARAKATLLHQPVASYAYLCWQLLRGGLRRSLEKLHLHGFIRWFRQRGSILRKSS